MKKLSLLILLLGSLGVSADELNFSDAARMVIQSGGRKKPLDTFASESLQTITGRRALNDSQSGRTIVSIDALLSMWYGGRDWKSFPLVLISDAGLKQALDLPSTERLFSMNSLSSKAALHTIYDQIQGKRARREDLTSLEKEAETVFSRLQLLSDILSGEALTLVPNPTNAKAIWLSFPQATAVYRNQAGAELESALKKMKGAYLASDAASFSASAHDLRATLSQMAPNVYPEPAAIEREIHYNRLHPFRWAWVFYAASFFVLAFRGSSRLGLGFFAAGLAFHIYGFGLRCWIAGRAPVTNMYESVVWVSLGVAAFAFVFGQIYRSRIYVLTAAPLTVLGLIFSDLLPSVLNSNIGPLPPVLRDNFWLVTHVLTITLGYAAFALAMGLGHVILSLYLLKPGSVNDRSEIHQLLYRVLQIGVLLLAAGTILGGVWANYSWGRFWGWDPKETWALIALLLYIFAVHGRLAGWWGNFGLSVAAVVCFNGVLMAWYGVNFVLGKGLHSYGFGGGGVQWLGGLVAVDLLFIGYCIIARIRKGGLHQKKSSAGLDEIPTARVKPV